MKRAVLIVAMAVALTAAGRNPDGTLAIIQTPNNGQPVFTAAGGTFSVTSTREAQLFLVDDANAYPLAAAWEPLPGNQFRARCTVPADTPPALYAIEARHDGITDTTLRAVDVRRNEEAATYLVVHLASPAVTTDSTTLADVLAIADSRPGAFLMITGSLTATGDPAEFEALLTTLDNCAKATVVCSGPNDGTTFDRYFAGGPRIMPFGNDGFLLLDERWPATAAEVLPAAGAAHALRRTMKPGRWSIGVSGVPCTDWSMRSQLDLLADDPLDTVILSGVIEEDGPPLNPWGRSAVAAAPPIATGQVQVIRIDTSRVSADLVAVDTASGEEGGGTP